MRASFKYLGCCGIAVAHGSNPIDEDPTKWLTTVFTESLTPCTVGGVHYQYILQDLSNQAFTDEVNNYHQGYHNIYDSYYLLKDNGFFSKYYLGIGMYGDKAATGSSFCHNMQHNLSADNGDFYHAYDDFKTIYVGQSAGALLENIYSAAMTAGFIQGAGVPGVYQTISVITDEKYQYSETRPDDINMTDPGPCVFPDACDCPGPYYDHDTVAAALVDKNIRVGFVIVGDDDLFNWYADLMVTHAWGFATVQQVPTSVGDWYWALWQTAWRCEWVPTTNCSGTPLEIEFLYSFMPGVDYPGFEYYRSILPSCIQDLASVFPLKIGFVESQISTDDTCFSINLTQGDYAAFKDFVDLVDHYDGEWLYPDPAPQGSVVDAAGFVLNNRAESGLSAPLSGKTVQIMITITHEHLTYGVDLDQSVATRGMYNGDYFGPNCSLPSMDVNKLGNQLVNNHVYYHVLSGEMSGFDSYFDQINNATKNYAQGLTSWNGIWRQQTSLCYQLWNIVDKSVCQMEPTFVPVPLGKLDCEVNLPSVYFVAENGVSVQDIALFDEVGAAAVALDSQFPGGKYAFHEFASRSALPYCAEYNTVKMTDATTFQSAISKLTESVGTLPTDRTSALDALRYASEGHESEWTTGSHIILLLVTAASHVGGDGSDVTGLPQSFGSGDGGCDGDYLDIIPAMDALKALNVSIVVGVLGSEVGPNFDATWDYWTRISGIVEVPMQLVDLLNVASIATTLPEILSEMCGVTATFTRPISKHTKKGNRRYNV